MPSSKVCHVCHAGYRGLYILHTATKVHQRKLHPTPPRGKSARREAFAFAHRHSYEDEGEDKVTVSAYRRRKPINGPRKVVHVRKYWRDRGVRGINNAAERRAEKRRWR